jgi:hypothetical protein
MSKNAWYCINEECNRELGEVLGSEFHPASDVGGENLQTRGPNLVVRCPNCGTPKVWYTADPITRAMYQLVDAISTQAAKRMISKVSEITVKE